MSERQKDAYEETVARLSRMTHEELVMSNLHLGVLIAHLDRSTIAGYVRLVEASIVAAMETINPTLSQRINDCMRSAIEREKQYERNESEKQSQARRQRQEPSQN